MEKKELRRLIRQRKSLVTPQRQAMAAEALLRQLSEDERYAHAHCLLLYASLPDEVPTLRLLEQASARHPDWSMHWRPRTEARQQAYRSILQISS